MLYISRYIRISSYGVVDTDDDVEEEVNAYDLGRATNFLHIKIAGVDNSSATIKPYQPLETKTPLQTKLLMLSHVDVVVWDGMITNIRFDCNKITSPVTIRLSDFGTLIGDFVLRGNEVSGQHKLTLVFDDNLCGVEEFSFSPLTCRALGREGLGVVFDLREVKGDAFAKSIYRSLLLSGGKEKKTIVTTVLDSIEDDVMRKIRMHHVLKKELEDLRG